MIHPEHHLPVVRQCGLLDLPRSVTRRNPRQLDLL